MSVPGQFPPYHVDPYATNRQWSPPLKTLFPPEPSQRSFVSDDSPRENLYPLFWDYVGRLEKDQFPTTKQALRAILCRVGILKREPGKAYGTGQPNPAEENKAAEGAFLHHLGKEIIDAVDKTSARARLATALNEAFEDTSRDWKT